MVLNRFLESLPLSQQGRVFVGVAICFSICAIPLATKKKAGHDMFSSEKPQEVYDSEIKRRRDQLDVK